MVPGLSILLDAGPWTACARHWCGCARTTKYTSWRGLDFTPKYDLILAPVFADCERYIGFGEVGRPDTVELNALACQQFVAPMVQEAGGRG